MRIIDEWPFSVAADQEGRYRIEGIEAGSPYVLSASAPGFGGYDSTQPFPLLTPMRHQDGANLEPLRPLATGEERRQDISLVRGWGVLANLIGADGNPVKEARLGILNAEDHDIDADFVEMTLSGLVQNGVTPQGGETR